MITKVLDLDTEKGDIEIHEDELPTITEAELIEFGISRETLHDCFADGVRLMQSIDAWERVRPCAAPRLDGEWEVRLVRYSELSDRRRGHLH
jgi:hypothetical protein